MFSLNLMRRAWVRVILAIGCLTLLASAALSRPVAYAKSSNAPNVTVVLVHGAWADGSSWNGVIGNLREDGYRVVAPPNPLRGLAEDSSYLAGFLQTIPGPIILVGHSYGGAVISNAAAGNPNVKALVFIDAFIPDQGENVLQLASAQPGSCLGGGGDPTKVFNFVPFPGAPSGDFDLYLKVAPNTPYPGFARCFANDLPVSKALTLAATQRPVTLFGIAEPSGAPAWKSVPSWAVIGSIDNVIPPAELLFMAQRAQAHITTIQASHLSMISQPDAVSGVIDSAARATA